MGEKITHTYTYIQSSFHQNRGAEQVYPDIYKSQGKKTNGCLQFPSPDPVLYHKAPNMCMQTPQLPCLTLLTTFPAIVTPQAFENTLAAGLAPRKPWGKSLYSSRDRLLALVQGILMAQEPGLEGGSSR